MIGDRASILDDLGNRGTKNEDSSSISARFRNPGTKAGDSASISDTPKN